MLSIFSEGLLPSQLGLSFVFTLILSMSILGNKQRLVMSVMGNISHCAHSFSPYAHSFSHYANNLEHSIEGLLAFTSVSLLIRKSMMKFETNLPQGRLKLAIV